MTFSFAFTHKIQSNGVTRPFWNCSSSKEEKARGIPCALNHQEMFLRSQKLLWPNVITYI